MLLFSREVAPDLRFAAWKVEESPDFFRDQLPLTPEEQLELSQRQHPLRQSEWLASRWLLHLLTGAGDRMPLRKTATSKPFFPRCPPTALLPLPLPRHRRRPAEQHGLWLRYSGDCPQNAPYCA